jgi:MFS family permease
MLGDPSQIVRLALALVLTKPNLRANGEAILTPMVNKPKATKVPASFPYFLVGIAFAEASYTMTMVQVPVFLRELGADIRQIGLFFTIAMIFPLILRILGGWLSDTIGRLRALLLGSVAGALAYIPYALAPTWQVALLGPALLSVATALIAPSFRGYIADTSDEKVLGRVFGLAETVRNIAWIFGPPLGGFLAQQFGYRWMFAAAIFAYGIAATTFLLMTRGLEHHELTHARRPNLTSLKRSLRDMLVLMLSGGLVTWLLITDGVYDIASKMSFDLMPVYLSDIAGLSKQSIGLLDGLHGIAWVSFSLLGGWLVDKTSERPGVIIGLAIVIASRLVFAIATGFWGFAASWIMLGIGGAVIQPALNSLVAKGVPSHLLGITFALLSTSLGLISLPFPWIGSQIWNLLGPKAPFLTTVVVGSLSIIPAWFKLVIPETQSKQETSSEIFLE